MLSVLQRVRPLQKLLVAPLSENDTIHVATPETQRRLKAEAQNTAGTSEAPASSGL